jgi:hypothetical protein
LDFACEVGREDFTPQYARSISSFCQHSCWLIEEEENGHRSNGGRFWAVDDGDCFGSDFVSFYSADFHGGLSLEAVEIFKFDEFAGGRCVIFKRFCPLGGGQGEPCPYIFGKDIIVCDDILSSCPHSDGSCGGSSGRQDVSRFAERERCNHISRSRGVWRVRERSDWSG